MIEDNRMPNFWWCPTHHLYRGGDKRPCADAVRLVPDPPAPRVWFPGEVVPAGVAALSTNGAVVKWPSDWKAALGPCVEVFVPSSEEWQAAVDQALVEREEAQP